MLQLGLAMMALALRMMTSKKFMEFINIQVERWWDEDIPNKEKKAAVIKDAKNFFSEYSEELISLVIRAVVGSIRLKLEEQK